MVPYCLMSVCAVFSPMPGTPGILSDASPMRPMISITPVRRYAEPLLDIFRLIDFLLQRVVDLDVRPDELENVLVSGDDGDVHAVRLGFARQRGNHIVCFLALLMNTGMRNASTSLWI